MKELALFETNGIAGGTGTSEVIGTAASMYMGGLVGNFAGAAISSIGATIATSTPLAIVAPVAATAAKIVGPILGAGLYLDSQNILTPTFETFFSK